MFRDISLDIKYFDMKILFIITALCEDVRKILRDDMNGFSSLIEYLEVMLKELKESNHNADVKIKEENKLPVSFFFLYIEDLLGCYYLSSKEKHSIYFLKYYFILFWLLLPFYFWNIVNTNILLCNRTIIKLLQH